MQQIIETSHVDIFEKKFSSKIMKYVSNNFMNTNMQSTINMNMFETKMYSHTFNKI